MKIINPNIQEITDFEGIDNFYKAVARAARICYASDKINDEQVQQLIQNGAKISDVLRSLGNSSDKKLCERLIKSGHYSPFEHAIIYFPLDKFTNPKIQSVYYLCLLKNKFTIVDKDNNIVAINGRVLIEEFLKWGDDWSEVIEKLDEDYFPEMKKIEIHPNKFKSFIVDTSIGCTREMNRHHDNFYICEQSTRFCNFSKDKFDGEVSFNKPYWYDTSDIKMQNSWEYAMRQAEFNYLEELRSGVPTDIARGILPLDTHTSAIYTATIEEWQHIIDLRLNGTTGKPHGDIKVIAKQIKDKIYGK